MGKISKISGRKINDSRGEETLEVELELENGSKTRASVPQGKSKGNFEAIYVLPGLAIENIENFILPALKGLDPTEQSKIDQTLIGLDGTENKSRLGANAILAVSIVCARAAAKEKEIELWQNIRTLADFGNNPAGRPRLFANVINGGLHAQNNLDFQEYLIISKSGDFEKSMQMIMAISEELKNLIVKKTGNSEVKIGDEGGWAPDFSNNIEPFEFIKEAVVNLGLENSFDFGLDAAASNVKIEPESLTEIYSDLRARFSLYYLEDPFGENDFRNFGEICRKFGDETIITGDDLTTTNLTRMENAHRQNCITGVIIKPNQIGTLSETLAAIKAARQWGWRVIVSHRSGETEDDFISDLAFAVGADGIKIGLPVQKERLTKYQRLLKIENK